MSLLARGKRLNGYVFAAAIQWVIVKKMDVRVSVNAKYKSVKSIASHASRLHIVAGNSYPASQLVTPNMPAPRQDARSIYAIYESSQTAG